MWYLPGKDNQPKGPYSTAVVTRLVLSGKLAMSTLCWRQGMAAWLPLSGTEPFATQIQRAQSTPPKKLGPPGQSKPGVSGAGPSSPLTRMGQEGPIVRRARQHRDMAPADRPRPPTPVLESRQRSAQIGLTSPVPSEERTIWEGRQAWAYHVPGFIWCSLWIVIWIVLTANGSNLAQSLVGGSSSDANASSPLKNVVDKLPPGAKPYLDNRHLTIYLTCFFVIMLFATLWRLACRVLRYLNSYYVLTNQRFRVRRGILSRHFCQTELFRVKDFEVLQTLWGRLFNYSHIRIVSSDRILEDTTWKALPNGVEFADELRSAAQVARSQSGVTTIRE